MADAHQLSTILDDLLLAVDPRQEVPRSPVDLAALLHQAVAAAEPAAGERGVRLEITTTPVTVDGYDAGLRRAVNALLDNGIRHARGLVRVMLTEESRQALVEVADDGPGLDASILPTLFTRFTQAPTDTPPGERRRYGLGLSLVSDIAARHNGSVSAATATPAAEPSCHCPYRSIPPGDAARRHDRRATRCSTTSWMDVSPLRSSSTTASRSSRTCSSPMTASAWKLRRSFELRKNLVLLRCVVLPIREVVNALMRGDLDVVAEPMMPHYQDVYDHVLRATVSTESLRDLVTTVLETNLTIQGNRLNLIMKKVTSWAAILALSSLLFATFRHRYWL